MKKGIHAQSNIVSVSILIVIVITLGVVIFNFSNSYVKKQKTETEGFSYYYSAKLSRLGELATSPSDRDENFLVLGVRREDNEGEVLGVRFIFEDNSGNSYSKDFYNHPPNEVGIIRTYRIDLNDLDIELGDLQKVSLSLLYGKDKATEVLDEVYLD